jgi:hypothetical protein
MVEVDSAGVFVVDEGGTNVTVFKLTAVPALEATAQLAVSPATEMRVIGSNLVLKGPNRLTAFDKVTLAPAGSAPFAECEGFSLKDLSEQSGKFWLARGLRPPQNVTPLK